MLKPIQNETKNKQKPQNRLMLIAGKLVKLTKRTVIPTFKDGKNPEKKKSGSVPKGTDPDYNQISLLS